MLTQIINDNKRIIVFDGICRFCSSWPVFIHKRDRTGLFKYTTVQSRPGQELLAWCNLSTEQYETLIYIENGTAYFKSQAVLKIAGALPFPWRLLAAAGFLPLAIRDRCYDFIAARRYRIMGRRRTCMIPTGDLLARFL